MRNKGPPSNQSDCTICDKHFLKSSIIILIITHDPCQNTIVGSERFNFSADFAFATRKIF